MKLILTKPGCKKCEYAKQTYDLSDWLIFDIENPTTFLDEYGILATIDAMAEVASAQAYLVAFKALPLLVEDGVLLGVTEEDIENNTVKPLKICNQYLKRKRG